MPVPPPNQPRNAVSVQRRLYGLSVHLFTASGALWGFLALLAAVQGDIRAMFFWLAVALFVDGIDGTIARKIDIESAFPRFSGVYLDLVVDYLTYVIVPAFALVNSDLLPEGLDLAAAAIIVLTSALYFADNEMKTDDAWFKGFPAVWNLIVFYLFLLSPEPYITFGVVVVLGVMTFLPVVFVHPLRVKLLRLITVCLLIVWSVAALWAVWRDMDPEIWVTWLLCAIGLYFLVLGVVRVKPKEP